MIITKGKIASLLTGVMLTCGLLLPTAVNAQVPQQQPQQQQQETPDYSDEQIDAFVATTQDIMEIQENYQEKMVTAIEDEGLTVEEFQSMSQAQQMESEAEMDENQKQSYANAMTSVNGIQQEMQQEMQTVVEENDMDVQEYQQMSMHVQQSPELSQKVNTRLQGGSAE